MAVTGRPMLWDLFDESPTPHITHPPRMHQRHFYVATDGSYRPNDGGLGAVIETRDDERVARIALPDVPSNNNISKHRVLHLGLDILAHRVPLNARVGAFVDHDDLVANVNNAALAGDYPDWQSSKRIVVPASSEHHWRGVQTHIVGFGELRTAWIDNRENPAHPLMNALNEYERANRWAGRCVLPDPPESEADLGTSVGYPSPLRFRGRASDWTQAVVGDPPFTPPIEWAAGREQSHQGGAVPGRHR